jgi:hypothetical protein
LSDRLTASRLALAALAISCAVPCAAGASAASASPNLAASGPAGSIGVQLLDEPTAERNDPRARVYIVDRLAPGTTIHRQIGVSNTTHSTMYISLYSAAATIAHGSFLGAVGHTPNDLSSWTTVTPSSAKIPSGGHRQVDVTVAVPRDAAAGEQYAVIWAQTQSAPHTGRGVIQVSRVGIRLYLSVGPGAAAASNFTINSLTAKRTATGKQLVVAEVQNTGGRAVDLSGNLQLSDGPGGLSTGLLPVTLGVTLGLRQTEPVTVPLATDIPDGPWKARITLRSGLLIRHGTATITFPNAGTAGPAAVSMARPGLPRWVIAAIVGLIGLLLLATLAALIHRSRRRLRYGATPRRLGVARRP